MWKHCKGCSSALKWLPLRKRTTRHSERRSRPSATSGNCSRIEKPPWRGCDRSSSGPVLRRPVRCSIQTPGPKPGPRGMKKTAPQPSRKERGTAAMGRRLTPALRRSPSATRPLPQATPVRNVSRARSTPRRHRDIGYGWWARRLSARASTSSRSCGATSVARSSRPASPKTWAHRSMLRARPA